MINMEKPVVLFIGNEDSFCLKSEHVIFPEDSLFGPLLVQKARTCEGYGIMVCPTVSAALRYIREAGVRWPTIPLLYVERPHATLTKLEKAAIREHRTQAMEFLHQVPQLVSEGHLIIPCFVTNKQQDTDFDEAVTQSGSYHTIYKSTPRQFCVDMYKVGRMMNLALSERRAQGESKTNDLTGHFNRRAYDEQVPHALAHARRGNRPVSLIYWDVDRLKYFNDTYDRGAGDDVLKLVGNTARRTLGSFGTVYHISGDEFAALVEYKAHEAEELAFRLSQVVSAQKFHRKHRLYKERISVTVGVVEFNLKETPQEFLERADALMHEAKRLKRRAG